MSTDKELYKLELLSLVSRVSQELFNHTKLQDKNLAEFVIAVSLHLFVFVYLLTSHSSTSRARICQLSRPSSAKSAPTFQNGSSKTSTGSL
jgi:hypothetical protein